MNARRRLSIALVAALGLCTGLGAPQAQAQAQLDLKVGYIPAGIYAYFWRASEAKYFAQENLKVELVPMAGGGVVIPALQAGSIQFGISDALGVINARNNGINVKYVSLNFAQAADDPVHAVMTNDPGVKSAKDLVGKNVATNLRYNTDWTMMREWLRRNGVDPNRVNFQEVPFPDMLGAVRNGTLGAAGMVEPFYTLGGNQGFRVLGHYFTDVKSPVLFTGILATEDYIRKNEPVVERFVRAVNRAIDDFNRDPQIARQTIGANTKIPPEVVKTMRLGRWSTQSSLADMQFWIDAARKEGIVTSSSIRVEDMVWQKR
jgi:NitT/TauT family transport system substrate-binding protein